MPGVINRFTHSHLPLQLSRCTGHVFGHVMSLTCTLTYFNDSDHPVDGIFICSQSEEQRIVAFECDVEGRTLCMQLLPRSDNPPDVPTDANSLRLCRLTHAKFVLSDADLDCVFVANVGTVPTYGSITVFLRLLIQLELDENGVLLCRLPHALTPRYYRRGSRAFEDWNKERRRQRSPLPESASHAVLSLQSFSHDQFLSATGPDRTLLRSLTVALWIQLYGSRLFLSSL